MSFIEILVLIIIVAVVCLVIGAILMGRHDRRLIASLKPPVIHNTATATVGGGGSGGGGGIPLIGWIMLAFAGLLGLILLRPQAASIPNMQPVTQPQVVPQPVPQPVPVRATAIATIAATRAAPTAVPTRIRVTIAPTVAAQPTRIYVTPVPFKAPQAVPTTSPLEVAVILAGIVLGGELLILAVIALRRRRAIPIEAQEPEGGPLVLRPLYGPRPRQVDESVWKDALDTISMDGLDSSDSKTLTS